MALLRPDISPEQIADFLRRNQTQRHRAGVRQKASDALAGATALPYRALGAPVDMATALARPFGYSTPDDQVVGGSEWLLKKAQAAGLHPGVPKSAAGQIGDVTGQVLTPGAGPGEAKAVAGLLDPVQAIFAGFTASRGAPMDALAKAEEMAEAAKLSRMRVDSPEWHTANSKIHEATGVHFGLDMHPRWEIDDSRALVTGGLGSMPRREFMQHSNLDYAYPASREIPTTVKPSPGKPNEFAGSYDPRANALSVEAAQPLQRQIGLHELQHFVQKQEGFDGGSYPGAYPGTEQQQMRQYLGNWGEMEARAVEARRDLDAAQRRARYPLLDYQPPLDEKKRTVTGPSPAWPAKPGRIYGLFD